MFNLNITDEMAEELIPGHNDFLKAHLEKVQMTKAQYLEKMAAAFVVETDIPASECVLVQEALPYPSSGWKFYYERRRSKA